MQGQNGTFWPIHWYARRQKCVSRSATEAEAVALAEGTYEDALPSMFLALPVGLGGASTWQALSCGPEPDAASLWSPTQGLVCHGARSQYGLGALLPGRHCLAVRSQTRDTILPSVSIPLVAVIQVVEKGFSVKLRRLPRTQRLSIAALSEIYSQGQHFLRYVESAKQLADILTKALERQKFVAARHAIGLQPYATKGH